LAAEGEKSKNTNKDRSLLEDLNLPEREVSRKKKFGFKLMDKAGKRQNRRGTSLLNAIEYKGQIVGEEKRLKNQS